MYYQAEFYNNTRRSGVASWSAPFRYAECRQCRLDDGRPA
jgi:hypothetical protein